MSALPKGWAETKVGEIMSLNYGKSLPAADRDGGKFVVFGSNGAVGQHSKAITAAPAIIVGRKGSFGEVHFSGAPCFPIDTTYYVDSFEALEARFAFHLLRHLPLTEMNRASAIPGLNRADAYSLDIKLPPLSEQRRIVAKVDGMAARTARARKELDRIPILIARYKQRLLALATEGRLTRNWRDENGERNWIRTTVAEVAETTFDGPFGSNLKSADYVKSGVRVVRLENIGSLRFIREKETFISKEKFGTLRRHELKSDDVLFSSFIAEEIRVCLMPRDLETTAINKADCFCVRSNLSKCLPQFLAFRLGSPTSYQVLKEAVHGATRPRISLSHLKQFEFDLPPLEEQAEIVRRIECAFGWLDRMAADHAAAARLLPKLDAAILAKTFRGELVPQDPNDEPASMLLERIKGGREAFPASQQRSKRGRVLSSHRRIRDGVIGPARAQKESGMTKDRNDPEVKGKPYLTNLLHKMDGTARVEALYARADLELVDFYKQLSEEHDKGWLVDDDHWVKAA